MSNQNPTVINNRYELGPRIGRGGMADVFIARDLLLDRDVAVKVLFPEHAVDPNFVERFRREAQAVAGLNHPNIVGVYDWGQTGNTYFMAMEYVKGRTLADALRRQGKLVPRSAAMVAAAIANALAYAHRNNVVHRDIKPANILMGDDGAIKVVDFGIARALDAAHDAGLTQDGAVMGTATYFSPEQAKGEGLDLRSDLYSLGIVLYELVAGVPPFTGDSALATAYKQVNEDPVRLKEHVPTVPMALEAIVAKCMAKDATVRYASAEQLRDDLRRFINGEPTLAVDEARARMGKAPLATNPLDEATTVMSPVGDAADTMAMPAQTSVMPKTMAPVETLPDYDDDHRPNRRNIIIGAVAAGVAILGALTFLIVSMGGSAGIDVPDLKGKTCDVAKAQLEAAEFVVALSPAETVCDATNIVMNQSPLAGDTAAKGEAITLLFAQQTFAVPPVTGLTEDAARAQIEAAGFVFVVAPTTVIDSTRPAGQVSVQQPAGGEQLAKGEKVTVYLAGGSGKLSIPSVVIGQTTTNAQNFLAADPYALIVTVQEEASATVPKGVVVRTDPVVGTLVEKGSAITLYVSSGPSPVSMPSVKGMSEAQATSTLTNIGLGVTVEYADLAAGNVNIGKVISQGTAVGTMVTPGTKIVLTVGRDAATAG